jgi:hypothetical protein
VILLFGLVLGLSDLILRSKPVLTFAGTYLAYSDWSLIVFFLLFYVYGYLLYADARFIDALRRAGPVAVVLGIACWLLAQRLVVDATAAKGAGVLVYVAATMVRGLVSWCWLVALVSLALRWFTFTNRALRYLDDAFYPVYVLHMPVLSIIAYYVVRWPVGTWVKYPVIVVATLAVTLLLYDLLIRRHNLPRVLFGLKALPAPSGMSAPSGSAGRHVRAAAGWARVSAHRAATALTSGPPARRQARRSTRSR